MESKVKQWWQMPYGKIPKEIILHGETPPNRDLEVPEFKAMWDAAQKEHIRKGDNSDTGLRVQFIPVYPGTFKWYWMKIKGWFARRK